MSAPSAASFEARSYWAGRLGEDPELTATGTRPFGVEYQHWLYRLKEAAIGRLLRGQGVRVAGATVLNVGCGHGYFERLFARHGARHVVGADFVASAVEALRRRQGEFEYHTADITKPLPECLEGRTFDVVTAIDVLYHIVDDAAFERAVRNLCSLCRPNGGVLLWTDAPRRDYDERNPHCRYRDASAYADVFVEYGLVQRAATPMYSLFDVYHRWSEAFARRPRVWYPLMYGFDRLFARFGWRATTNYAAIATRGEEGGAAGKMPAPQEAAGGTPAPQKAAGGMPTPREEDAATRGHVDAVKTQMAGKVIAPHNEGEA